MRAVPQHFSSTGIIAALLGAGMIFLLLRGFIDSNGERTTVPASTVALLAPAAPPPPPPPEIKPPEPEKIERIQPTEIAENLSPSPGPAGPVSGPGASPSGPLGLNDAGSAGSDAFGLAGRAGGGKDLLLTGGGGGGYGELARFAGKLQLHIKTGLDHVRTLERACYSIDVQIKVADTGGIEYVNLRSSSGDRSLDTELRTALLGLAPLSDTPPANMPWPVTLRIVSRGPQCAGGG